MIHRKGLTGKFHAVMFNTDAWKEPSPKEVYLTKLENKNLQVLDQLRPRLRLRCKLFVFFAWFSHMQKLRGPSG